jgi:hypothetical protein
LCGFLLLAVFFVFGQTLRHEFVNFDDGLYVFENPSLARGLTVGGIVWAFTTIYANFWHPMTWLSLMSDFQLYGLNPWGYHLTNFLLHAATSIIFLLVFPRMTGELWPSAFVAAVFAIDPLHVESVAWVAERKDVLSGLFFALTLAAYVRYVGNPASWGRYLVVVMLFALGLMAKPMLVTLPCLLLVLDYWPLGRMMAATEHADLANGRRMGRFRLPIRLVVEKIPLLLLAAVFCMLTSSAEGVALVHSEHFSLQWRLGNAALSYVAYLRHFFYPLGLTVLYPRRIDLPTWQVITASLLLLGITLVALLYVRRRPYLLVGWLWYVGMSVPVIGLVQFGIQAEADRFTYLPQIGLCIALAWTGADLCKSWPSHRWICGVTSAFLLATLAGVAWRQTSFWRDSETLWNHNLACTLENNIAHNNLGNALYGRGEVDEAIAHYQKALEIKPDDAKAHANLGVVLASRGRMNEAIGHCRKALVLAKQQNKLAMVEKLMAQLRLYEAGIPRSERQQPPAVRSTPP